MASSTSANVKTLGLFGQIIVHSVSEAPNVQATRDQCIPLIFIIPCTAFIRANKERRQVAYGMPQLIKNPEKLFDVVCTYKYITLVRP